MEPPEVTIHPDEEVQVSASIQPGEAKWSLLEAGVSAALLGSPVWLNGTITGPFEGASTQITLKKAESFIPPSRNPCRTNLNLLPEASPCNPIVFLPVIAEGPIFGDTRNLKVKGVAPRLVIEERDIVVGEETIVRAFVETSGTIGSWDFDARLRSFSRPTPSQITAEQKDGSNGFEVSIQGGIATKTTAPPGSPTYPEGGIGWLTESLEVTATQGGGVSQPVKLTGRVFLKLIFLLSAE